MDAIWPLAAIVLVTLLGVRAMQRAPRSGEGRLAAEGFLLSATRDDPGASPLSPDGLGALHVAVYDTLTRVFDRADTLVAAGRELVLVVTVLAAVLLWRTARRLGFGHPAAAAAVLLAWVPALWFPALLDLPAQLAVPWLLVAAWLTAGGRPSPAAQGIAVLTAAVATLLAPVVLVLLLSGAVAALWTGVPRRATRTRTIGTLLLVPVVIGTVLLLPRWDPEAVGLGPGTLLPSAAAFLVVGGLAAWVLERLRAPALALVATTLTVLLPSGRLSALIVCLPLAAVLTVGVLRTVVARPGARGVPWAGWPRPSSSPPWWSRSSPWSAPPRRRPGAGPRPPACSAGRTARCPPAAASSPTGCCGPSCSMRAAIRTRWSSPGRRGPPTPRRPCSPSSGGRVRAAGWCWPGSTTRALRVRSSSSTPRRSRRRRRNWPAVVRWARRCWPTPPPRPGAARRNCSAPAGSIHGCCPCSPRWAPSSASGCRTCLPRPASPTTVHPPAVRSSTASPRTRSPPGAPATERLLAWLDAQQPPFAPASVTSTDAGVLVEFSYVSTPDALVSGSAP